MVLTINTLTPITLSNASMSDNISSTVYNLTYQKQDLSPLPITFTATIEDDSGNVMFNGLITDYVKTVNTATNLTLRINKK